MKNILRVVAFFLTLACLTPPSAIGSITSQTDKTGPTLVTASPQTIPVGFPFQAAANILVLDIGPSGAAYDPAKVLTLGSDYTVTGGGYNGSNQMQVGSIVVVGTGSHVVLTNDRIVIMRNVPLNQITSFGSTGPLTIGLIEQALDKMATLAQQVNEVGGRALQFENFEFLSSTLSLANRKNAFLAFDSSGRPWFPTGASIVTSLANPISALNIAALKLVPVSGLATGVTCQVCGYYFVNDGGGGVYVWNSTSTTPDDGGSVIQPAGITTGRWLLQALGTVNVRQFGATGDGVSDDTAAFTAAMGFVSALNGGIVRVPLGTYVLKNLVIDKKGVIFQGESTGYTYSEEHLGVRIIPGSGAIFAARLKGTASGVTISAAASSGFKNVQFYDASGACDYGLFIDSGATILEEVSFEGFQYGCVIADEANSNVFTNCSFVSNVKCGFAVTEWQGANYMYPNVSSITSASNTKFEMNGCVFRQNGFGMVLRSVVGASFTNCLFESNDQAGIYMYRTDLSSLRQLNFKNCWFENNYVNYTSGSTSYSVTGNRLFLIGNASTYIAWTSAYQAGYQMVIDSQTHYGGGGDTMTFQTCQFACDNAAQKAIKILSGFKYVFNQPWFTGGDTANLVIATVDAEAIHWYDPLAGNDPAALVTSITDNFGANAGSRGAYFKSGTSFGTAELGGTMPVLGVFGGPIQFQEPVASDPRRADARTLNDYFWNTNTSFSTVWRVGSAIPFTVNTQTNEVTKVGRLVTVNMRCTVTAVGTSAGADRLYVTGLPYSSNAAGVLTGQAWVQATGGGATVLNGGLTPLYFIDQFGLYAVLDVFPAIAVGYTYDIRLTATYVTDN